MTKQTSKVKSLQTVADGILNFSHSVLLQKVNEPGKHMTW